MNWILGVRLTAVVDSDHSGTVLDLPYVYSTRGIIKEPNIVSAIFNATMAFFSDNNLEMETNYKKKVRQIADKNKKEKSSDADVFMLSGWAMSIWTFKS